jgi:uncharacterized protein YukE
MNLDVTGGPAWLDADPERLLAASRTLGAVAEALDRIANTLNRDAHALDGDWDGEASTAFAAEWAARRRELAAQAVTYRDTAGILDGLAWALETAQRAHASVAEAAAAEGVTLLPDGTVAGSPPLSCSLATTFADALPRSRRTRKSRTSRPPRRWKAWRSGTRSSNPTLPPLGCPCYCRRVWLRPHRTCRCPTMGWIRRWWRPGSPRCHRRSGDGCLRSRRAIGSFESAIPDRFWSS